MTSSICFLWDLLHSGNTTIDYSENYEFFKTVDSKDECLGDHQKFSIRDLKMSADHSLLSKNIAQEYTRLQTSIPSCTSHMNLPFRGT